MRVHKKSGHRARVLAQQTHTSRTGAPQMTCAPNPQCLLLLHLTTRIAPCQRPGQLSHDALCWAYDAHTQFSGTNPALTCRQRSARLAQAAPVPLQPPPMQQPTPPAQQHPCTAIHCTQSCIHDLSMSEKQLKLEAQWMAAWRWGHQTRLPNLPHCVSGAHAHSSGRPPSITLKPKARSTMNPDPWDTAHMERKLNPQPASL